MNRIAARCGLPYTGDGQPVALPPEVDMVCTIVIPGEPIPKARPRLSNGHVHTAPRTAAAEARIREYLFAQDPRRRPVSEPVMLVTTFHTSGKARGDLDNYVKLASDALNGIVWKDDRQVHALVAMMFEHSTPCTVITVRLA
jgi:Holliday junction resolvase RusA-like endonuclease